MEDIVKRLLFFALATLLLVPSAFGYDSGERFNFLGPGKWASGRPENWTGPQDYSQDDIRRLTGRPPLVSQQAGEGVAVRAHVTHVPRLGRAHRVNER